MQPPSAGSASHDLRDELKALAEQVAEQTLAAGADAAEVLVASGRELSVKVRRGEPEMLHEAGSSGIGLRVFRDQRAAVTYTSDFTAESLARFVRDTVELSLLSEPDELNALPGRDEVHPADRPLPELELWDDRTLTLTATEMIERARAAEAAGLGYSSRISNSDGASCDRHSGHMAFASADKGGRLFSGASRSTYQSLAVEVMCDDADGKKRNATYWTADRFLDRLQDPVAVGREAARRAESKLGARKIETAELPVVFDPDAGRALLRLVASTISGGSIYRRSSYLCGREGTQVASPLITIVDDPLLARALGSRPFDGDGLPVRKNVVIEGGVLKGYVPPYLYDPGSTQGYSNYATSLAGYIVQRVSGQAFDDYIEQHVLGPLGMKNSTFRQPLPAALQGQMSQGYLSQDEPPKGFEIISMPPAGSLSASGSDMGRFMIAYLQQGRLGDAQILKPETVRLMHGQLTRQLPGLSGIGLGFYEQNVNGHRVLAHGGDTVLFHSDLLLFVDDGIGLFVSVNGNGANDQGKWLRDRLFEAFADRYLPDTRPATPREVDEATAKAHAKQMAGAYRNSRREDSTFLSLLQLLGPMRVQALDDGRVAIDLAGSRSVFREVKPYLWEEEHGKRRLQAVVENGRVRHWGLEPYVFAFIFEPVPFMASTTVLVLLCAALGVVLLTVLLWPVAAVLRRRHGVTATLPSGLTGLRAASVLTLVGMGLWAWVVMRLEDLGDTSVLLPLAQTALGLALVAGLVATVAHLRATLRQGSTAARAMAVVWLACFGVLLLAGGYHHLLGFNQQY